MVSTVRTWKWNNLIDSHFMDFMQTALQSYILLLVVTYVELRSTCPIIFNQGQRCDNNPGKYRICEFHACIDGRIVQNVPPKVEFQKFNGIK